MLTGTSRRVLGLLAVAIAMAIVLSALPVGQYQAAAFQSPVPQPVPSCSGSYYTVRYGDTLARIASRYGVSLYTLMSCNRIKNANLIWSGMRLLVPGKSPIPNPPPPPPPATKWYRVVRGDTVSRIAARFGVSTWQIIRLNGLRFPYIIYVGQWLRIR
jgi:LysM repeat protein